jgi:REP element-mobilizing transposase RayT
MNKREKKHRLDRSLYKGFVRVSYTICAANRKKMFENRCITLEFIKILKQTLVKNNVKNWIYVFMPDHLHLIAEGNSPDSDLWKTIKEFKQKTTIWLKGSGYKGWAWQEDYYDHVHRKEDDLREQLVYAAGNPVRTGIAEKWDTYEFTGSLDYDLKKLINN